MGNEVEVQGKGICKRPILKLGDFEVVEDYLPMKLGKFDVILGV